MEHLSFYTFWDMYNNPRINSKVNFGNRNSHFKTSNHSQVYYYSEGVRGLKMTKIVPIFDKVLDFGNYTTIFGKWVVL